MSDNSNQKWRTYKSKSWTHMQWLVLAFLLVLTGLTYYFIEFKPNVHRNSYFDVIAPEKVLFKQFDEVVFESGISPKFKLENARKWMGPLKVASLVGAPPNIDFSNIQMLTEILPKLTGISIAFKSSKNSSSIFFKFTSKENFVSNIQQHLKFDKQESKYFINTVCAARIWQSNKAYAKAIILIQTNYWHGKNNNLAQEYLPVCASNLLIRTLGFPKRTNLILPSIFSLKTESEILSINDKIIIRTLYDDRITPGMPRAEANEMAKIIIPELIKAVKERGEEALYQKLKY